MNNLSGFLAALIAGIMVLAHRSDDFSTLRRHRSQKYRVHFFKDPAGKYVSFINLKATFNDPDVVDIEPEKKRFLDFDDDKISDDWTIIVITPAPLLETLPTPDQMVSTVSIFKSKAATTTPRVHPDPTIPELPSTSTAFPREEPDYPVNDRIPGIEYLKPIKIPHKIRHHKLQNGERLRADVSIPTASHVPRLETGQLPSDDEDYVFTKHEASSIISLTSTSRVLADTDLPTTSYSSLTTSVSIFETTLSSLLEDSTGDIADTTAYFSIYATSEASMSTSTEMLNTTSFNDTYFYEDWAVVNETQISPKEVLHEDPLGRNETELKELLTNLSYLEQDEDGVSHQDYGASFLVPVLKRVDYDNNSVPLVFQDVPVNVKISLNIIHLANFDSQQMEYTIDLEMKMSWFDIRLANNYTKPIRIREKFILDQIWRPDPYFVNSKYSYFHMVSFPNFRMRIKPNGLVTYALR